MNRVLSARGLHARTIHEQFSELSLPTVYRLLAALMQALSLGSFCVAISLLKWVSVTVSPYYLPPSPWVTYSFGMPHHMNVFNSENLTISTETRKLFFDEENTEDTTTVLVTLSFLIMFSGFAAFLLDFVELQVLGRTQVAFVTLLHIFSGIFIIAFMVICIWCYVKTKKQLTEGEWKELPLSTALGESFYIILMSFAFIMLAIMLSGWSMKLSRKGEEQQ